MQIRKSKAVLDADITGSPMRAATLLVIPWPKFAFPQA
jgi:hypothetical protein